MIEIKNILNDISKDNELLRNELVKAFPNEFELKEKEYFYKNKKGEWCIWKNPDKNAKVVTIWKPEKTADELFEELGYEKSQVVGNAQQCYFANAKGKSIAFNLNKTVSIFGNYNWFTMQELKAINKKVEELGWKQ